MHLRRRPRSVGPSDGAGEAVAPLRQRAIEAESKHSPRESLARAVRCGGDSDGAQWPLKYPPKVAIGGADTAGAGNTHAPDPEPEHPQHDGDVCDGDARFGPAMLAKRLSTPVSSTRTKLVQEFFRSFPTRRNWQT